MKRYAVAGISNRAIGMFIKPLVREFADVGELVAVLDKDALRFQVLKDAEPKCADVPTYLDHEFDKMIAETKPDVLIVVTTDVAHAQYIIAGLRKDLDVITEKPMTINVEQAKAVLEAEKKSNGKVTVTFNYRYPAVHQKVKEIVLSGRLGRITHVDLNWYLDSYHGASYFKRWNRIRDISGGLSIHKASHHFDLLNWWIGQDPVEVFAYGALNYYGADGPMNPEKVDGRHCATCSVREKNPYEMRWKPRYNPKIGGPKDDHLGSVRSKQTKEYTGYSPDACIFDSEIKIEDTYVANILYDKGVMVAYSSNWSLPFEGYRLAINGTLGRLETQEWHSPPRVPFAIPSQQDIDVFPLFGGAKETICVLHGEGGHGGGDPLILEDIFLGPKPERKYELIAGARAGAMAVAVGEAVWKSAVAGGKKYRIADLLGEV
jgi:predicted dehydrogenase